MAANWVKSGWILVKGIEKYKKASKTLNLHLSLIKGGKQLGDSMSVLKVGGAPLGLEKYRKKVPNLEFAFVLN